MEKKNSDLPVVIGQTGPLNGQKWAISESVVIGRDPGCGIVIPDRQVSRYHARLTPGENGITLEDLASKNGTYCNGKVVVEPIYLQDGDVLQIALVQHFVFLSSDATMPMEYNRMYQEQRKGKLYLEKKSRRVWVGDKELVPPLSAPQFRMLQALYDQQGKVVARSELINAVWGAGEAIGVTEQALDALVRRLRDRIAEIDPNQVYIVTVRGHGLRLENPPIY